MKLLMRKVKQVLEPRTAAGIIQQLEKQELACPMRRYVADFLPDGGYEAMCHLEGDHSWCIRDGIALGYEL